jgi:tetratricopeptide (TPR) repeat protein
MNRHHRRANAKLQRKSNDSYAAADSLSNLGIALRAQGKLDEAISAFRQAVRVRPDVALFHFNLGAMLHECRRFDEAVVAYRQAIQIKSDYAEAYSNLGTALRDLDKQEEAITVQRQAIQLKPNFAAAHCNLGAALYDQGRLEEAVAAYRQAIILKPNFDVAHGNLGAALIELGRSSEGRSTLKRAVRLAPGNTKHRRYLGELEPYTAGDPRLAGLEQLARDAAQLPVADRIELHFALGKAYDDIGRHAEAFRQWRDGNALKRQLVEYNEAATLSVLDRTRSVFTPDLMSARRKAGHPSSVPVFIVGMPRSGTTLVEQIIASYSQVFGAGELRHFDAAMKGIRMKLGSSKIFPEVVLDMTDTDFYELGARYLAEIEKLAPAGKRIIDKRPTNFQVAGLIHLALPNALILHTTRDPIDTCLSCFSKLFTDKQVQTYDLAELGRYYRNYQKLMAHWERVLPVGRILNVRYEDIVIDLEGQARRIIAHCGLDWDPRCLTFYKTERPVRTASAVQVRKPIYNSAIGRARLRVISWATTSRTTVRAGLS